MRRVGLFAIAFVVGTLLLSVPIGIFGSSNLVWGEPDQYGRVQVPGAGVLHLPSGTVDVSAAAQLVGRGNETPDFPLPADLAVTVTAVSGSGMPTIEDALGDSSNAMADGADTQRRVWRLRVPVEGDYRVRATGSFAGAMVNPQLWFGHGPPLPGALVPVIAASVALVGCVAWLVIWPRVAARRRARRPVDADVDVDVDA